MTEQHRTVAAERDLPRVHEWLNRVVAHAMREAHAAERCIQDIRQWLAYEQHLMDTCESSDCLECEARSSVLARLSALLPALPESSNVGLIPAGGGDGMDGTRVTRGGEDDRELGFGGDDDEAAFGGSETGGGN